MAIKTPETPTENRDKKTVLPAEQLSDLAAQQLEQMETDVRKLKETYAGLRDLLKNYGKDRKAYGWGRMKGEMRKQRDLILDARNKFYELAKKIERYRYPLYFSTNDIVGSLDSFRRGKAFKNGSLISYLGSQLYRLPAAPKAVLDEQYVSWSDRAHHLPWRSPKTIEQVQDAAT